MADDRARTRRAPAQPGLRTVAVQAALDALAERRSAELGRPLRVLDVGGGTGGTAVPLAAAGHDVTVVDPSPDALASLRRRAAETGTSARVHPVQGDTDTVAQPGPDGERASYDLVCLHGTLEVVDDPATAVANLAAVLAPGGTFSLVVAQRLPAALARALAGQFARAQAILERPDGRWGDDDPAPRRFDESGVLELLAAHGLTPVDSHGVRIFSDLVPSALVDSEADRTALLSLEAVASTHPTHAALLGALGSVRHVLATRD
ncbi:class I SAM-dependent methyltransferase [Oryzobacter telluris]|uniref:class I SAM-dependent methyltransferase n=1 Tax=Oryzobacter telluris TaxID=3149179 RepID=UPI00370DBC65